MGLILLLLHQPLFPPLVHLPHLPHSENLFDSLAKKKGTKKTYEGDAVVHYTDKINLIPLTGFVYR